MLSLDTGSALIELTGTASWFLGRSVSMELEGAAFGALSRAIGALLQPSARPRGAEPIREQLRRSLPWSRRREGTSWLSEAALRRALAPAARARALAVRIGPLRTSDLRHPARALLQISPAGFRLGLGGPRSCACPVLWDIQQSPWPREVERAARRGPLRACVALTASDLALLAASLREAAEAAEAAPGEAAARGRRWIEGRFGARARLRPLPPALGCPRCRPAHVRPPARPEGAPLPRLALQALRRLGVHAAESRRRWRPPATALDLPLVTMSWGVAWRRSPPGRGFRCYQHAHVGSGLSLESRLVTARAEVIERACAMTREPDLLRTPPRALAHPHLPLASWALFSEEQRRDPSFPYPRISADTPLDWLWAEDLARETRLLVPAQLTFSGRGSGPPIVQATTSGLAAHLDRGAAALGALLEVIERDALQIAWYGGTGARLLDLRTVDLAEMAPALAWLGEDGWRVSLSWIAGRAGQAVVVAIAERSGDRPPLRAGGCLLAAAAAASIHRAARHAVRELQMIAEAVPLHPRAALARAIDGAPDPGSLWRVHDLADIVRLYLNPAMRPAVDLLLQGPPLPAPAADPPDDLPRLIAGLAREELRPLLVDMSAPAARPFVAVQAILVGAQPLAFGTGELRLGSGLLPCTPPPRDPPLPSPGQRPGPGTINPYILPLA